MVGSIVGGGFRLIREHPAAVAIWGAIYLVLNAALFLLIFPSFATSLSAMQAGAVAPAQMGSFMGLIWGYDLVLLVAMVVLFAAAFRAVFRPEDSAFGYLRLGMDELRLLGLGIVLGIVFFVAFIAVMMVVGVIVGLLAVAAGGQPSAGGIALTFLLMAVTWAVALYFEVRLSLAFPLTLLRGRITVGEAWRLTRGRFWTLFGAYLILFLIMCALSMVILPFTMGPYLSTLAHAGGDPQAVSAAAMAQMQQMTHPGPLMIVTWIVGAVIGAIGIALGGGAMATATSELLGIVIGADGRPERLEDIF